jgi:hypothetical protein
MQGTLFGERRHAPERFLPESFQRPLFSNHDEAECLTEELLDYGELLPC